MPGLPNHPAGTSQPADPPCRPAPAPPVHDLLHHLHRLRPGPAWWLVSLFSTGAFVTLAVVVTAMATVLEVAVGLWRELRELPG
jgi:hypothetical protein